MPPGVTRADLERAARAAPPEGIVMTREAPAPRYRGAELEALGPQTTLAAGPANVAVTAPLLSPQSTQTFFLSAWVRCNRLPTATAGFSGIAGKYQAGNTNASEWLVGVNSAGKLFLESTGAGSPKQVVASSNIKTGWFHHVAAQWETNGTATLWMDGRLESSAVLARPKGGGLPMIVGDAYPPDGSHALKGRIDEMRIWIKKADTATVQALFAAAPDRDKDGLIDGNDPDGNNDGVDDAWAARYFNDRYGGDPNADLDKDSFVNREESIAGTDPTNPYSYFRAWDLRPEGGLWKTTGNKLEFEVDGVAGRIYQVWTRSRLITTQAWVAASAPATCGQTGPFVISVAANPTNQVFYRVTVNKP